MTLNNFIPLQSYLSKIKALGYSLCSQDSEIYINAPDGTWTLKYLDARWALCINDEPQIYFAQDEVVKFLAQRKFRQRKMYRDLDLQHAHS